MKQFLFLAAAATMLFAGCQKTEVVYDNPEAQEIAVFAVNQTATKAPVEGTTFPEVTMKVGAYLAAGDGVTSGGRNYFDGTSFNKATTYWTGGKYWPLSAATLNFLAVAPEVESAVTTTFNKTNHASSSVTTVTSNETNQHDVMYAVARVSKTAGSAPSNVSMTFNHAYSWVDFYFKKAEGAPTITINKITVNDVSCNGTFTVTATNAGSATEALTATGAWSGNPSINIAVNAPTGEFSLTTNLTEYNKGILLIPADPMSSFVINYTIDGQTFDYTYTPSSTLTWEAGKKYVYNITMSPSLISIDPKVTEWTSTTSVEPELK